LNPDVLERGPFQGAARNDDGISGREIEKKVIGGLRKSENIAPCGL
jgi:hypothetical protein